MALTKAAREAHIITVGVTKVVVTLPDYYDGTIGPIVGIKKKAASDTAENYGGTKDLIQHGQAVRLALTVQDGTKNRQCQILCDIDKARVAIHELVGKKFRGGTIKTARFPLRKRYR